MTQRPSKGCPAILIAAPASGQGKTTVACALARLHTRQGRRVRVFKCGPDFLDPYWLSLASGEPVYQLDLWMTGEADCARRLHQAALEADFIIVEGVMGLFDGEPSAADLAERFGLPILAVVDASAMAGTFGALAWGLEHYRDGLRFAGVLANRVASEPHAGMLQASLREPHQWLGALMQDAEISLPERHLGLVMAHEMADASQRLDAAADALAATPLGQMSLEYWQSLAVAFEGTPAAQHEFGPDPVTAVTAYREERPAKLLQGVTIAVARDAAFCFIYDANIDCLRELGAEITFFSPLVQRHLPSCDAVWLPGGYPELHAAGLSANHGIRDSLAAHVQAGKALWAECGGMMVLFDELVTADGDTYPMWGLLAGSVAMQKRLAALGPQQLALVGGTLRGHTFHYSTCSTSLRPVAETTAASGRSLRGKGEAFYTSGPCANLRASYFHAWFASSPQATASLFLGNCP